MLDVGEQAVIACGVRETDADELGADGASQLLDAHIEQN
jgi:hypothetical protein